MKRWITTVYTLLICSVLFASHSDSLKAGNELYKAEKYEQALKTYKGIIARGYESAELYYNIGNTYYKTGSVPNAILYYEKAKLLSPGNEDIQFNLDLCNQFVVDKIEPLPRPFFVKGIHKFINSQNTDGWGNLSLITFVLMLLFIALYLFAFNTGIKKVSFIMALLMVLISGTSIIFASKQKSKIDHRNSAIIFMPTVTVKASPDDSGTALFVIHEGLKVDIVETVGDWYQVKIADGNTGWIKKEALERI